MSQTGCQYTDAGFIAELEATAEPAFACGDDGRIVAWNASIEDLLGYSAQQVLGKPCWEILCGLDAFGNKCCCGLCDVRRSLSPKESVRGLELDIRKASGEIGRFLSSTLVIGGGRGSQHLSIHRLRAASYVEHTGHGCGGSVGRFNGTTPVDSVTPADADGCPPMTGREIEILGYLADGRSRKAVARALDISVLTVHTHIRNILRKYEFHNIREAISVARRHGLI